MYFPAVSSEQGVNKRMCTNPVGQAYQRKSPSCFDADHCKNLIKCPLVGLFHHEVLNSGLAAWQASARRAGKTPAAPAGQELTWPCPSGVSGTGAQSKWGGGLKNGLFLPALSLFQILAISRNNHREITRLECGSWGYIAPLISVTAVQNFKGVPGRTSTRRVLLMDGGNFSGADYSSRKKFGFLYIKMKSPLLPLTSANTAGQMAFERLSVLSLFRLSQSRGRVQAGDQFQSIRSFFLFLLHTLLRFRNSACFQPAFHTVFVFALGEVYKPEQLMYVH